MIYWATWLNDCSIHSLLSVDVTLQTELDLAGFLLAELIRYLFMLFDVLLALHAVLGDPV